jgi:hypothetical protein
MRRDRFTVRRVAQGCRKGIPTASSPVEVPPTPDSSPPLSWGEGSLQRARRSASILRCQRTIEARHGATSLPRLRWGGIEGGGLFAVSLRLRLQGCFAQAIAAQAIFAGNRHRQPRGLTGAPALSGEAATEFVPQAEQAILRTVDFNSSICVIMTTTLNPATLRAIRRAAPSSSCGPRRASRPCVNSAARRPAPCRPSPESSCRARRERTWRVRLSAPRH